MKKLILSCLLALSMIGCAHQTVVQRAPSPPTIADMPKDTDTLVVIYANEQFMVAYDSTSVEKKGDVVSFLNVITFNVEDDGPQTVAGAIGRTEINCQDQTSVILSNHLVNSKYEFVREGEVRGSTPIKSQSIMRVLFEEVCDKQFHQSVTT